MICFAGCVTVPTAGCLPVVPSFWKEGLGVVEKNNVRHICFICCDRVCSATTPHPSSPEEGITLGARHCSGRHGGLPLPLGVTQSGWLTLNSPLDPQGRFQSEAGKEL